MIKAIDYDLVVVGSSAGGIEALSILVSTLPVDFPVPMVLAQHLDPNHPSHLHDILQRQTSLSIVVVGEPVEMEPGKIYVVPSNNHVIITDGHVALRETSGDDHSKPSVDLLLSTAAAVYGERLIAVILTGSGSDGAAGAIEVKQAGGTIIVQNPRTARYPSMPLALPPSAVDFESDIENIGALLNQLLTGSVLPPVEDNLDSMDDDQALQHILDTIGQHTTIDFNAYKKATILRRISRRMTVARLQTLAQYAEFIATHATESSLLINAFLINVTRFFRDPEAFAVLKDELLPALIVRQRSEGRTLRFWSAGCATGEEPYSLAMLVTDLLGTELPDWNIKIFATDVDESAINFARRGLYTDSSLQGMPPDYVKRFFDCNERGCQIDKTLRQMITFGQHDLSQNGPFSKLNLVICRNVLIYFSVELQDQILNAFTFSLYPNGYLFLGKAETVRTSVTDYELINKPWKIYRCIRREMPPAGGTHFSNRHRNSLNHLVNSKSEGRFLVGAGRSTLAGISHLRRFNDSLLRALPMGVMIIDRSYHLMTANLTAQRLLGIHEVGEGQDFLHAAHGIPYEEVRTAIDTAFRDRKTITIAEIELSVQNTNSGSFIALTVMPMQLEADMPDVAAISVSDITPQVEVRRRLATLEADHAQLLQERGAVNQHLNEVNEKLLEVNERLQVSNDDLILSHEELQSTLEDFETTNEELQASTEEMETTNEELQASNEELQTTNDEVTARTLELQKLTDLLTDERARLAEMVELAPFYILVLRGPDLRVQAFNPQFGQLMNASQLQGQPLRDVAELFHITGQSLTSLALQVYQQDTSLTTGHLLIHLHLAASESVERYFVFTLKPSHMATGDIDGVVIYAEDVTEQRQSAIDQEQSVLEERGRLASELHDTISQTLWSISLVAERLPLIWETDIEAGRRSLTMLHELTLGAQVEMRSLLLELRPSALTDAPLGNLIRQLASAIANRTGLIFSITIEEQDVMPSEVQFALYRVVQEAFNNIVHHAQASQVEIYFNSHAGQVELTIRDNGVGFDTTQAPVARMGLSIMNNRIQSIGAQLEIISHKGEGTSIKVAWKNT